MCAQMREKVSDDWKFCRELRSFFEISANSIVNFSLFCESCGEVVEVRKLMFLHKFNDFAGYRETFLNFWFKLNCDCY